MQCDYFDSARCRSCTLMGTPYDVQLAEKDARVRRLLAAQVPDDAWATPFAGPESGFRNKAKLAVGGTTTAPTLGLLDRDGAGVDLRDCGIHEPGLREVLPRLAEFVTLAAIEPYRLSTRRGELKNLLVTRSPTGELMLRFVLRSQEAVARIRKHLPALRAALPQLHVVSVNILPEHRAVLEGDLEIPLTAQQTMPMPLSAITVHLRPQSFFQTNTAVADALYAQAVTWSHDAGAAHVWDLYCGVGGFGLHLAAPGRRVVGVESSAEAIASARISAAGLPGELEFVVGDATEYAARHRGADLIVVNPPRRGIGELAGLLDGGDVRTVLYSSCNAESLARDLDRMPSLRPARARLFDMFPQTWHHEVLVLLERA
ncbi:methyltransferase domain-containing protein [Cumulibacter manganitolerans]|uniref:methyltransferase domain-containing protein n=1 Tax=Cumulibacter manganitolerans TaxID=1884992 RepID=UPI001294BE49|nr:methyltransferase domain-containing protein [Cumulibacter manganitolerans]